MRIAMVADVAGPSETTSPLPALAGALSASGHDVALHVRQDGRPSQGERGFRLVDMPGGRSATRSKRAVTRFAGALADRWRAEPPDVVHACSPFAGAAAVEAAARVGVPVVYGVGEGPEDADETALSADHVVVPYNDQRRRLLRGGLPREKVSVVPFGLDVDHFTPDGDRTEPRTAAHRIVTLGPLEPGSGFGTSVAALVALRDTELVVVGGPAHGKHATELRAYARSLGVAERLVLAGGVPHDSLPALLRSADLVVCTPWVASFGIAAVEAMACGVAVVANGVGGLADTVVHGVTGLQVAPRRPRELAAALRRMLSGRITREQQGAAGRDRAATRYSWNFIADQTANAYQRVLRNV
ncbi:glycosyltransferase [Actinophytocola glycyrrhizae]|uniref:Glycosyltransferase n=1 Tax=Actinophytocola glycyrrhizae TaxID=2044873 RepID=A0ABV9S7H5_9PSEU